MPSPDRNDPVGTRLLLLARAAIRHGLAHDEVLRVDCGGLPRALAAPAATFVTLRLRGELRGCCGTLEAERPVAQDAARSAFFAAFRDPRFDAVIEPELDALAVEISVLSPLSAMRVSREADLLEQLVPGTDGLVIVEGKRRATFLPGVWETLPNPRHFLAELKKKCGLPGEYWSERLEFLRYRTTSYADTA